MLELQCWQCRFLTQITKCVHKEVWVQRQTDAKNWAKELLILNKRLGITRQNIKCIKHYHPQNSL